MTTEDEIRALLAHIEETAELLLAARGDPNGVRDGSNGRVVDTPRSSMTRGHTARARRPARPPAPPRTPPTPPRTCRRDVRGAGLSR
jgi:hypothetical protein